MTNPMSLVEVLRSGRQADPDGVEVRISRQAVEEAAGEIERLQAECLRLLARGDKAELELNRIKDFYARRAAEEHRAASEPGGVAMRPAPGTKALSDTEHAWLYDATRHDPKLYSLIRRLVQYGVEQDPPCMLDGPAVKSDAGQ